MPERLIDANALIQNHCGACSNKEFCAEESCPYYEIRCRIENAPTIEAEPVRHGLWDYDDVTDLSYCSECGTGMNGEFLFCPFCGAKMDAADDQGGEK